LQIDTLPGNTLFEILNDFIEDPDEVCNDPDAEYDAEIATLELCMDTPSAFDSLVKYKFYFNTSEQEETLQAFGCFHKSRFVNGFGSRFDLNHIFNEKFTIDGLITIVALVRLLII
jgi:hypothetical protein